jgi:7,8-dihydro-6-hydroxymethylpterin-pyrophosphokinase
MFFASRKLGNHIIDQNISLSLGWDKNFVLIPMAEINEGYIHPILNKTIKQLALQCADTLKVNMFIKN